MYTVRRTKYVSRLTHTCLVYVQRSRTYTKIVFVSPPPALSRLLNSEGSLMAFAGKSDRKEHITAAVAANIWMSNEKSAKSAFQDETLQFIVMDCEV